MQAVLKGFELVAPLGPRDAFFGGQTGAVALLAEAEEDEEIRYVDVTSLNKNAIYPIGHPKIITRPEAQRVS